MLNKLSDKLKLVNFYLAIIISFLIPTVKIGLPIVLVLWILTWLLEGDYTYKLKRFKENRLLLGLVLLYYIMHLVGLIYTDDMKLGTTNISVKSSFFIFPFIMLSLNSIYLNKIYLILKAFVLGNVVAGLACIGYAFYARFNHLEYSFYYSLFSKFQHPSYFGMYLVFSISIIFYLLTENKFLKKEKLIYCAFIPFFLGLVYLLSSKAGIITSIIVVGSSIILLPNRYLNRIAKIILLSLFIFLGVFGLKHNPRMNYLINNFESIDKKNAETKIESSSLRFWILKSGLPICKANYLLGVGTGDLQPELNKQYKLNKCPDFLVEKNLNFHNEYLETIGTIGLIGLLFLAILFGTGVWIAYTTKSFLIIFLLLNIGINLFFEVMFKTQAGVVFFAFFFFLLLFNTNKKPLIN